MNDPRERDLSFETESRIRRKPAPPRFLNKQLAVLVGLIVIPVLVYLAFRFA